MRCGWAARHALLAVAFQATLTAGWSTGPSSATQHGSAPQQHGEDRSPALREQAMPTGLTSPGAGSSVEVGAAETAGAPGWVRMVLAAAAMFAVVLGGVTKSARADGGGIDVYFGQGCFWHVQHVLAVEEKKVLGRKPEELTALAGYAGGTETRPGGVVCFHNISDADKQRDFAQMGHSQVVNVNVPEDKLGAFSKDLLDYAFESPRGRHDPGNRGAEFRSSIGLPGGMTGSAFKQIEEANAGRLQFVAGAGDDGDTVGTKKIFVYDIAQFPFHQGEIYLQYHDDIETSSGGDPQYSGKYHNLNAAGVKKGTLKNVGCPETYVSFGD